MSFLKFTLIMFIFLAASSQKRHCIPITKNNSLKLFRDRLAIYFENHKSDKDTSCGQNTDLLNVQACGKRNGHSDFKC